VARRVVPIEQLHEAPDPSPARIAFDLVTQVGQSSEVQRVGFSAHPLEPIVLFVSRQDGRAVEDRSGGGGHRYAVDPRDVSAVEAPAADDQAGPAAISARGRHPAVCGGGVGEDAVELRGAAVADNRARTASEDGSGLVGERRSGEVAHQIHATVHGAEPTIADADLDLAWGDAPAQQLIARYCSVLKIRQHPNDCVRRSRPEFATHTVVNPGLTCCAPSILLFVGDPSGVR